MRNAVREQPQVTFGFEHLPFEVAKPSVVQIIAGQEFVCSIPEGNDRP